MELNIIHGKFSKINMADINKIFLKKQRDTNVSDYVGTLGEIFYDRTQRVLKISVGGGSKVVDLVDLTTLGITLLC